MMDRSKTSRMPIREQQLGSRIHKTRTMQEREPEGTKGEVRG